MDTSNGVQRGLMLRCHSPAMEKKSQEGHQQYVFHTNYVIATDTYKNILWITAINFVIVYSLIPNYLCVVY